MRPKQITLSPTALDRNGISAAQTLAAGDLEFLLAGALSAGLDRNGIAEAQTPAAAGALTLNGALGVSFPDGTRVSVYGAADESGKSFTVTGTDFFGNKISETITGPNATTVFGATVFYAITSVEASAATTGDVEVGVQGSASFTTPQHVTLYAAADESGKTFTVVGENRNGDAQTETITGPNAGTVAGVKNWSKVTKVTGSAATTGGVEVGVDGTCESSWLKLDRHREGVSVGIGGDMTGTLTWTVQQTYENFHEEESEESEVKAFNHATLAGETTDQNGSLTEPAFAIRFAITAFTSGSLTGQVVQA